MQHMQHRGVSVHQRAEFIAAFYRYGPALYRYYFFRVYSQSLAEDLVQETFLRAWRYLSKGKKIENMQAFLYRISRNLIIDLHRKKIARGIKEESLDTLLENGKNASALSYDGRIILEQDILLRERLEHIQRLSQNHRQVLTMRYVEGLAPKEIAQILDTRPNTISSRIYKATKALDHTPQEGKE